MATLGGYAQRQSQTASAADTTLQALMMLMQYQQQAEDRRLSREQMQLQNQQLQGLLRAQQREEVAQTSGTAAIRDISDVENQSAYGRLDQTIKSLNIFMDSPELATDPVLNADLGLSAAVRSMQSGSPEEYAKVIRVLNAQLEQVQSMIDNSEVPAKEAERFMKSLRSRIKNFANHSTDGVIFQRAYLQVLSEDNARGDRGADGELISASLKNPGLLIPDDPLIEVSDVTLNSFGKQAVQAGIDTVARTNVDSLLQVLDSEDASALTQHFEDNPEAMTDLGLASDITAAAENIIGNIPPAQESLIDRGINYAKENPGTATAGVLGAGYLATKFAPLLKYLPPVAGSLTGAEILGRMGQEQGLLPGEGVLVGDDSMLWGSLSDISRAQELQERLPEDQRVGPIEGVLQGAAEVTGEAIRDLIPESLLQSFLPGMLGGSAADPAPQTAAAPAEGVIEKEVVRRDFGAEIPEQVTLEDLVAPAPPAAQYDPLDIEMQASGIPAIQVTLEDLVASTDPSYLADLQFKAALQKAKEANRELAAILPNWGISASGDVVESLEARQRRMAQTNEPAPPAKPFDPSLMEGLEGSLGTALDMPVGRRRKRETTDSRPAALDLPVGARSKAVERRTTDSMPAALDMPVGRKPENATAEPVATHAALANLQDYGPFDEKESQRRQQVADVLNQIAIDNMLQATRQEVERQALIEQMAIENLLQTTPPVDPRSLYALMGQPF